MAFAWSTAVFAYLLDRVKLRDAWLDPADPVAHPRRYGFLLRHRNAVRGLMATMALVSAATGLAVHPLAPLATLATAMGVLAYAGWPRRRGAARAVDQSRWQHGRAKDVFVLKNLFVGAGIAGFAMVLVGLDAVRERSVTETLPAAVEWAQGRWLLLILVASHLLLRVFADAVLCDIDDEAADREHDTQTLPTRIGGNAAWLIAMYVRLGLAASLLMWPVGDWRARVAWAVVTAVSTIGLRVWRPRHLRDVVDVRFAVEAGAVWAVLALNA